MTHLEYLKENAMRIRDYPDGKYTQYFLLDGVAVYNNENNVYLWYARPPEVSIDQMKIMVANIDE